MIINTVILTLMGICFVLGAVDRLLGNRFGLGEKFEDGLRTAGDLMLTMVGIVVLAPLLSEYLLPVLEPMFSLFGADPAMFAGMFLANDMGGGELAFRLTQDGQIARFSGLIVASMLGVTVVFTIPSAMKLIPKQYHNILFLGISFGLIPIPVGALLGGLAAGLSVPVILRNLIPILIFIVILTVGIVRFEKMTLRIFDLFGHFINIVITVGLFIAFLQSVTGQTVIEGMGSFKDAVIVIGQICLMLGGAVPAVHLFIRFCARPCRKLGALLGIDEVAVGGMVATLANSIMTFKLVEKMPTAKGKLLAVTFSVSAAFTLGDHLAYTAAIDADMILPVIIAKLTAGVLAVGLAMLYCRKKPLQQA